MLSRIGVHTSVDVLFPPSVLRDALSDVEPTVEIVETAADLDECDALVTFSYDESFLDADLDWIHSIQSGVDRFPFDRLERRGIALTSSTGIHGDSVGETVVGYMLQFARRLHVHRDNERRREWQFPPWDAPFTLPGESLCVVGLGTLGQGIARRADALGVDVVGVKRTPTPVEHISRVYTPGELQEAIADVRFVAVAVPLTDRTEGSIGADEFGVMREDAYLLNVSRGGVVDDSALLDALRDDELAGAALDVFETEPLPDRSEFWERENVIVTPHAAAANREYYRRVGALVRENVRRLDANETLANHVV
ncbi:D-2-hydroxyacid dehydrogenase [Halorarum halophilum]|uniref:D-2-hydroxyacid dehydrogenase n=1 Tax=Halorarum halophilum TaxID=2743090 RepID=A0A7D5GEK2_9EURY|nr:D-2-hydroxyacid dehydrogenase [Halobaculum halophilum]QLG27448.1 D-2-hydroxyacid dehydrogenase [Halobaculum halophilum]